MANLDTRYEWRAVSLLAAGFGLVGLDRWIIAPLFPFMMRDLHLSYQDLGNIVAVLGIAWGIAAIGMGALSDRIGRRRVLIPAVLLFSLLSGLSGLAGGLLGLLAIRTVMGVTEGAFCPASVAAAGEASAPRRRGFNQGLQMSLFALFGLGFGPIVATQLLGVVPSWRWVFALVAIPGFIVAGLLALVIRDQPAALPRTGPAPRWRDAMRGRNVLLAMLGMLCAMSGIFVLSAMMPSYLLDYLHLTPAQMGGVTSALGFGGFLGEFMVPGLSDFIGRRWAAAGSFAGGLLLLIVFSRIGAAPLALFCAMFGCAFFCFGLLSLFGGPIATEAVTALFAASAVGIVSGVGEIFGGGVAPALAGYVAQHYGIQNVLTLAMLGLGLGIGVSLMLRESAPRLAGTALRTAP